MKASFENSTDRTSHRRKYSLVVMAALATLIVDVQAGVSEADRVALAIQSGSADAAIKRAILETQRSSTLAIRRELVLRDPKRNPSKLTAENFNFENLLDDLPAPSSADPKAVFDLSAAQVEAYCANIVSTISSSIKEEKQRAAKVNAGGLLVSAIGAVTANPPYKAFLMAIGISGGGDSKSVFGALVGNSTEIASLDQADLDSIRTNYQSAMKDYRAVDQKNDSDGIGRGALLVSAKAACDKLAPSPAAPVPSTAASEAKAANPTDFANSPKK